MFKYSLHDAFAQKRHLPVNKDCVLNISAQKRNLIKCEDCKTNASSCFLLITLY